MKVYIDKDEWWPVYEVYAATEEDGFEISDDLYKRYQEIGEEFKKVQKELAALFLKDWKASYP